MSDMATDSWNLQRVEAGVVDVVDWPEPGGWPGRLEKRQWRGHTNKLGWRWFALERGSDAHVPF